MRRRGYKLGAVRRAAPPAEVTAGEAVAAWRDDRPCLLPGWVDAAGHADAVATAHALMARVLESGRLEPWLDAAPWAGRLADAGLALAAASGEEHDPQGIEKVWLAPLDGNDAREAWCKASWLSFAESDASLRFRFSFGMEGFEDVAADPASQQLAAAACEALFPESAAITRHPRLLELCAELVGGEPMFVERIVYFNAPDGGAQMHHDVERGHAGVIFAQMSGATFWLACAKPVLMDELAAFSRTCPEAVAEALPDEAGRRAWQALLADRARLAAHLDEADHELAEAVMDRTPAFVRWMVERGHGFMLEAGDALLLPQRDLAHCVWHSVFCLGDEPGEGLSFALRRADEGSPQSSIQTKNFR